MRTIDKIIIILILIVLCPVEDILAQDTINIPKKVKLRPKKDPLRATMLAVAFPGLGQIYNRKYWKIPLVYAGFGGLAYSVSFNTSHYNQMMKAYQDFTDKIPETNSYIPLIKWADPSTYDPVLYPQSYNPSNASWVEDNLLKSVDYYKKYRDLSYIGIAAWYLITVLDANVDASLSNFDVTKNLNLAISPFIMPIQGFMGAGLNISVICTF
ncbi:MAG: DUF5683 domain-containing protein [Bacteroidota bacterium]|nr:DUF5683 domain-containing protein [Bacteroidota bacterium]